MKNHRKQKRILSLLTLALTTSFFIPAYAVDEHIIYSNGKAMFRVQYINPGDGLWEYQEKFKDDNGGPGLTYMLTEGIKDSLDEAFQQWADILAPHSNNVQPVQYLVGTNNDANASAGPDANLEGITGINSLASILQNGVTTVPVDIWQPMPASGYAIGKIRIGKNMGRNESDGNYGFVSSTPTQTAQSEAGIEITTVMFHEIGHSLGILSSELTSTDKDADGNFLSIFDASLSTWTTHLVDQYGNQAQANQDIITSAEFARRQQIDPTIHRSDYFIIDNLYTMGTPDPTVPTSGNAYFVGSNVSEVLDGKTFQGVDGVPINTWEGAELELSHIELSRSLMSHQAYRSYTTFMEAELAVMQDLGYAIDRKNYYGYSLYKDGQTITNTQGYSARNAEGTEYLSGVYNSATLGIGLHVYGSQNNVTQAANILTNGTGAAGIRIDGLQDTVTVAKGTSVRADGVNGVGVLVAYGRDNKVRIDGTVTANGTNGNGVQFDFGANSMGGNMEYRGSYLRYERTVDSNTGKITNSQNLSLIDPSMNDSSNGDLGSAMGSLDVAGTLSGSQNAVYIAKNAFVDEINILDGALIKGNITSEWKHFDNGLYDGGWTSGGEALTIRYEGTAYAYDVYIPDLVTQLNFKTKGPLRYDGNINGHDNMKMNIASGTLVYGGAADVVNVTVAEGAALYGGVYTVHDMSSSLASGFSDDMTGAVHNSGTIGASSENSTMIINGHLVSDGTIQAIGGGVSGQVSVSGTADIEGAIVTATNILPKETTTALTAGSVDGAIQNSSINSMAAASGMLSTYGTVSGNTVTVTAVVANNLGSTDAQQDAIYQAISDMYDGLDNAENQNELRPLYNLGAEQAKRALSSIGTNDVATALMTRAQQNTTVSRIASSRLTASTEVQSDIWVNFNKNWGTFDNDVNYHSSGGSLGYERPRNEYRKEGVFFSYEAGNFSKTGSSARLYDTRVGVYSTYQKGGREAYIYADYGWLRNHTKRSLANLDLTAEGKYKGRIIELGGEYKYDLHANSETPWHISPYAGLQASYLHQNGYQETGAGILGQNVNSKGNTYVAVQGGFEFKRKLNRGSYAVRVGLQQALTGADPELKFQYNGDDSRSYTHTNNQDKTHVVLGLSGEHEFAKNWQFAIDTELKKGAHDRNIMAALKLRHFW